MAAVLLAALALALLLLATLVLAAALPARAAASAAATAPPATLAVSGALALILLLALAAALGLRTGSLIAAPLARRVRTRRAALSRRLFVHHLSYPLVIFAPVHISSAPGNSPGQRPSSAFSA